MSTGDRKKKKRLCPDCRKSLNSKFNSICYDDLKANCRNRNDGGGYREGLELGSDCEKGFFEGGMDEYDDEDEDESPPDFMENSGGCRTHSFGGGSGVRGGLGGSFGGSGRLPILSGSTTRINSISGSGYGGLSGSRTLSGSVGMYGGGGSNLVLTRGLSNSEGLMGIGTGSSSHIQLTGRGMRSGGESSGLTRGLSSSGGLGEEMSGELSSLDVISGSRTRSRSGSSVGVGNYERYHRNSSPQRMQDQRL